LHGWWNARTPHWVTVQPGHEHGHGEHGHGDHGDHNFHPMGHK
jgi:hypothetical protein